VRSETVIGNFQVFNLAKSSAEPCMYKPSFFKCSRSQATTKLQNKGDSPHRQTPSCNPFGPSRSNVVRGLPVEPKFNDSLAPPACDVATSNSCPRMKHSCQFFISSPIVEGCKCSREHCGNDDDSGRLHVVLVSSLALALTRL
jgi:hypothetical protein